MNPLGPLPYEWLAVLALAILWVNALLVAGASLAQRRALGATRSRLARSIDDGTLVAGVVEEGRGPGGVLAARRIEQTGRAMTVSGPDRILFTDRSASVESFGGVVRAEDGRALELDARTEALEVWIEDSAAKRGEEDFALAWSRASTNKGWGTSTEQAIRRGDRVFVERGDRVRIAAMDPIAFVDRRRALLAGFALASLVACAGVTVVACWPPFGGLASTIGGLLGVTYFLAVPPLGTKVRDAAKLPPYRLVGGIWVRPA